VIAHLAFARPATHFWARVNITIDLVAAESVADFKRLGTVRALTQETRHDANAEAEPDGKHDRDGGFHMHEELPTALIATILHANV
jgi:hypothetical protein